MSTADLAQPRSFNARLIVSAVAIEIGLLLPHFAESPARQVGLVLCAYAVCTVPYVYILWLLTSAAAPQSPRTLGIVLVAGVIFRMTLCPLPAVTSPDVNRYLWEGLVQASGHNPYALPPDAAELADVRARHPELGQRMLQPDLHPGIAAVYPPTAQALFRLNAELTGSTLWGWKLILLVCEGMLVWAAWLYLRKRSIEPVWLAAIVWCPLVLLEVYECGHLDLVGAAFLMLGLAAWQRKRDVSAGIALGLAINVKYMWPGLALLVLVGASRSGARRARLFVATLVTTLLCWVPYRDGMLSAITTSRMFAESWTFNDVLFEGLRKVLVHGLQMPPSAPFIVTLVVLSTLAFSLSLRRSQDTWRDVWLLVGVGLLLSPVAYPWYFLWIVPGLVLRPPLWLVIWIVSVPLLHLVHWKYVATGQWDPMPNLWLAVGFVPGLLLIRAWWQRLMHPRQGTNRSL